MQSSRKRLRFSILLRVFGSSLIGLVLAISAISWLTLSYMDKDINRNADNQLNLAINLHQALIDANLDLMQEYAATAAGSRALAEAIEQRQFHALYAELRALKGRMERAHILTVVDSSGRVVARANSNQTGDTLSLGGLVETVLHGETLAWPAVISRAEWSPEGAELEAQVRMPIIATKGSEARAEQEVLEALALVGAAPVRDQSGLVIGAVIAAEILNQNHRIVDEVSKRTNGLVSATIAKDGIRVTTNVRLKDEDGRPGNKRAIGTVYSIPVMEALRRGEAFQGRAQVVGEWQRTIYVPLKDHTGQVIAGPFVGIPEQRFLDLRSRFLWALAPVVLGGVVVAGLLSLFSSGRLVLQLRKVKHQLDQLASGEGDLTTQLVSHTNDEISDLTHSFNRFLGTLRSLMQDVLTSSQTVSTAAVELTSNTGELSQAAEGISNAVQELARGASTQASAVTEASCTVDEVRTAIGQIAIGAQDQAASAERSTTTVARMVDAVEDVADKATRVSSASKQAASTAKSGSQVIAQNIERMGEIRSTVLSSADRIRRLGKLSDQIGTITRAISEISDQTNLLALNAAIEAARAGEHGRGFAVVADEVRKLAERAGKSATEISGLVTSIQTETTHAVTAMEKGSKEVEDGFHLASEAGKALAEILSMVEQTTLDMAAIASAVTELNESGRQVMDAVSSVAAITEENSAATEEMAAGADQVTRSMESIANITTETAAAAEEVSAAMEQMRGSTEEIGAAAGELSRTADQLRKQVLRFKL